jgi:hypothetical protein
VSPGFFEALGTPLVAGRTLTADDSGPVAVVNEEFVRRYFPGRRDVIGEVFAYGFPTPNFNAPITILGVVGDVRYQALDMPAEPTVYALGQGTRQTVVVSTSLPDPTPLISLVRTAVAELDPSIPVTIEPLERIVSAATLRHRLGLVLMVLFATLSLALAAVGIYGVVAHATGQRWPEVATRLALGATPSHVIRQLTTEGRGLAVVGLAIGVVAAVAGGRLIASRLYQVRAGDPVILAVATAAVLAVTFLAYLLPALRASRIHPAESLRSS